MAEISNKKKHMIIALIAALIIVISITVVLVVLGGKKTGNTENSKNREVYSEEEILDKCIAAINEGDGRWLTYCEICHSDEAIDFLEYYYEVCDEYGWEEVDGNQCKNIVENGYKEAFTYLKEEFGDEYKITYKIKSKENVDRDSVDIEDVEYGGASNVTYDYISGGYAENLENRLTHIGVPEKTIEKCVDLYDKTLDINDEIKEVYKAEVEFTVSGTKEIKFTEEIWFGEVGGRIVPFEYIEMWESDSWFRHMVITPGYIYEQVSSAIRKEQRLTEERNDVLEICIDAVNVREANWYTYDCFCNWHYGREILVEGFGESIDKYEEPKYVYVTERVYEEEFSYLEEQFGEEWEITYNKISEEKVEMDDIYGERFYYEMDAVHKLEVEFVVDGTKEAKFKRELWIVQTDGYCVTYEGDLEEEETNISSLKPIVIDAEYIVNNLENEIGE